MMPLGPTELIRSIESSIAVSGIQYQTNKVQSNLVSLIRSYIRRIYVELYEADQNYSGLENLRLTLLKLHASPVLLTSQLLDQSGLGDVDAAQKVWGRDFAETCHSLSKAITLLNESDSPLMVELAKSVSESIEIYGVDRIRIWVHRNEIEDYMDALHSKNVHLRDNNFIYSLPEYRKANSFDVLYRLGPLRSQGWSRTPKAVVSAPRYKKLIQVMWAGSFNDSDFGADPVIRDVDYFDNFKVSEQTSLYDVNIDCFYGAESVEDVDDIVFISERVVKGVEKTPCILVELPEKKGVLVTPKSNQLIFDRNDKDSPFLYRSANAIETDNLLLLYKVEADLGGNNAGLKRGELAVLWKGALKQMYNTSSGNLVQRMKEAGIGLLDLDRAAKEWIKVTDGEIIHGPQYKGHFKALIEVVLPGCLEGAGWTQAWKEIQDSRVEAIQHGRIEHAIVDEEVVSFLNVEIDSIRNTLSLNSFFSMPLENGGLTGAVYFYLVIDVASGYLAPHDVMGGVNHIGSFEKYRVDF